MKTELNEIEINGVEYVKKDSVKTEELSGDFVIIRADRAGVFAGHIVEDNEEIVILADCRRLYYWDGANTCSDIANYGVKNPKNCKFPKSVKLAKILGVIENIKATKKSEKSIKGVAEWQN